MKEDLMQNNHYIMKFDEINEYISLKCEKCDHSKEEINIVICIKGVPMITRGPLNRNKKKDLINVTYQNLLTNLLSWSKNDYSTKYMDFKIAFPLLKELRRVGETKFQIIFQQEILKEYCSNRTQVKRFLEQEGFLNLIGDFF
ncbi:MAG: hypothetical protein ACFE8B_06270 [Candidatus Hermodarchaeota archaeon]